jgi:hypothetical protein
MLGHGAIGENAIGGGPAEDAGCRARAISLAREIGIELIEERAGELLFEASAHVPAERLAVFEQSSVRPRKIATTYAVKLR